MIRTSEIRAGMVASFFGCVVALAGGAHEGAKRPAAVPAAGAAAPIRHGARGPVGLSAALSRSMLLAGSPQNVYIKVGLDGHLPERAARRAPANLAIVIDRSGSMAGDKIRSARDAARRVVERLGRDDILSVVTYDSTVRVLVPATRLTDKAAVLAAIDSIQVAGETALFSGVSRGAAEVRKFLDARHVNRVVLLSDGQANVGPSSPAELGALGASLAKDGISVSTIGLGLGYNEDLMVQLAQKSDGSHAFVEQSDQLARLFDLEIGDVLSVVASAVEVRIDCAPGVRPVRVLGRAAAIDGQSVYASVGQLYGNQEAFLIVEAEVQGVADRGASPIARVDVSYRNMATQAVEKLDAALAATFTSSRDAVERSADRAVLAHAVELVANESSKLAVRLRDEGKTDEARRVILSNVGYVEEHAKKLDSAALSKIKDVYLEDSKNLEGAAWHRQRKSMMKWQQDNREAAAR
jgi:Ca-activated chloride channel family protein